MIGRVKISYNAPVILSFVLLCFVVTLIGEITGGKSTGMFFAVYRGALTDPMTYIRCFTHVLGHAGFDHFIGNAMLLLLVGPMLEEKYGSGAMLKVILATAGLTGVLHCLLWSNTALCGASGIVFACIILSSFVAVKDKEIPLTLILVAVLYLGKEVYSGILIQDNVANLMHIFGGVVGCVSGFLLNRSR